MRAKDFSELAGALKDARVAAEASVGPQERPQLARIFDSLSRSVAAVAARQSPRFNKPRFLSECGVSR